jgi:hypothetical protein
MFQVTNCQASCTNSLFANAVELDLRNCQQACTNFPAESCRVDCENRIAASPRQSSCFAACSSICNFVTDPVDYQTGVSTRSLRPFCPASKLPVCNLSLGSSALGTYCRFVSMIYIMGSLIMGNLNNSYKANAKFYTDK